MAIAHNEKRPLWLLFVFSLPAKRASQRVEIWRLLKRYGSVGLRSSGYVLPNNSQNLERFEWLAAAVRKYRGEASVIHVESIDNLPSKELSELFLEARGRDYEAMIAELKHYKGAAKPGQLSRLRRRFQDVVAIDFFNSPLRSRVEELLANADARQDSGVLSGTRTSRRKKEFQERTWITRPRPGIDRVSSAWLILRFIDPQARFTFGTHPGKVAAAVAFDMFQPEGFGHRGDDCTFETLCKSFRSQIPK
jgi:Chromate resistance exported protein